MYQNSGVHVLYIYIGVSVGVCPVSALFVPFEIQFALQVRTAAARCADTPACIHVCVCGWRMCMCMSVHENRTGRETGSSSARAERNKKRKTQKERERERERERGDRNIYILKERACI